MPSRYRLPVANVVAALAVVALVVIAPVTASSTTPVPTLVGVSKGTSAGTWLTANNSGLTKAGDVMIAVVAARIQGTVSITPPAGWSPIRREATIGPHASLSQALYVHVATETEPTSYAWQFGAATVSSVTIVRYSNVDTANPVVSSSGRYISDSKNLVAPSVTVPSSGTMVLGFFANNSNRPIDPPPGFTEKFDSPVQGSSLTVTSEGADTIVATGATGDEAATVALGGPASSNIGQLVALRPGSGSPPPPPTPQPALSVATVSPVTGTTVIGRIRWEASTSVRVSRVEFLVDGVLKDTETTAPYVYGGSTGALDTTTVAEGSHSLTAKATAADGTTAMSTVAVVVANAPVASPPPPSGSASFYSSTSVWNTPIAASETIDANSSDMVSTLVANANASGFAIAAKSWTVPIYYADATTPKTNIALTSGWGAVSKMANVPVPANARPDPAGDAHMMIVDRSTNCEYDFWKASQAASGSWSAQWGNTTTTTGDGRFPFGLSARASGFALGAGLILPNEISNGRIDHALAFAYSNAKAGGPIFPATSSDGSSTISGAIPEGARVQLDPTLNLDALGLTSWQKTVARALQIYGMFLVDHGGALSLYAQNSSTTTSAYPWGDQTYAYLPTSIVSRLRVLQLSAQFTPTYKVVATGCAAMS